MRPHPQFRDRAMPAVQGLGAFTLRALTVDDLDRDFDAIMASADEIRAAHPGMQWPEGLTREKNLIDLSWHQREFEARRSFAWVIEDGAGAYLGCLYVYPSIAGELSAEVSWWWRTGAVAPKPAFRELVRDWLSGADWPRLRYDLKEA